MGNVNNCVLKLPRHSSRCILCAISLKRGFQFHSGDTNSGLTLLWIRFRRAICQR